MTIHKYLPSPLSVVLAVVLCLAAFPPEVAGQTREQLKAQAESRLQQMSPDQIDRKLKEYGITRDEAIRRARELNISLEEFLSKSPTQSGTAAPSPSSEEPTLAPAIPVEKSVRDTNALPASLRIPGISRGRGVDSLLPFGFEVFRYQPSAFEAVLNLSSPPSYLLGPGDEIVITVWGETKLNHQLQVNREGNVLVPDVGPVSAAGATLTEFRARLLRRMSSIYSGLDSRYGSPNTFLDVSLGKLRTIQVFVLGEVVKPGGYAVSSFATAFNALYVAGGPTVNGTMRRVQVMRKGTSLPAVDLYEYIVRGDNSNDHRLQDGDVVFVQPAGKRVAIDGAVVRPAVYELNAAETLGDALRLAGGLRFDAYFNRIHIERVIPFDERLQYGKDILDIDLLFPSIDNLLQSRDKLADGDVVRVLRIDGRVFNRVSITGNVNKPGVFELTTGMRVRDLILTADSLKRSTFSDRGTLFRMLPNLRRQILSFNPNHALNGDEEHDILLQNEDSVVVYEESRFFPQQSVTISGAVRNPGTYIRNEHMTIADLVVLAGGLREGASLEGWEVSRLDTTTLGIYSKVYRVAVTRDYWNTQKGQGFELHDNDFVLVPSDPRYTLNKLVDISGYVMNPGRYAIRYEGERMSEIIKRAGGLRPGAYLEGSRFIRRQNSVGAIPIDFGVALKDSSSRDNVVLKDDDSIHVAFHDDVIYVTGEVFVPSAILYKKGESVDYYIRQAGGFKQEADEDRVVAFLPSGKKWESGWFFFGDPELPPGSQVIVPVKIEREDKTLPLVRDIATILASLAAITVAIVQISK